MSITKEQRENVKTFIRRFKTVPPENVATRLMFWQRTEGGDALADEKATCGTIACAGGWMALMPEFQAMGVYPSLCGAPRYRGLQYAASVAERFFGDQCLFNERYYSEDRGTDKEVVLRRFERLLK